MPNNWNINYTNADLLTHYSYGNGLRSWMQETSFASSSHRVHCGNDGVSSSGWDWDRSTLLRRGWHQVLERIQ